jgi:lipopolysaccharide biosynthesis protein
MPLDVDMPQQDSELFAPVGGSTPVTIFVHVFHLEIWPEILADLNRLAFPYQLVLTGPHPQHGLALPHNAVDIEFHRTDNLGRDIGPFLTAFRNTRFATDICLKIHTKRSLHRRDGETWRRTILQDLLGNPDKVSRTVTLLRENPNIGLVSPNCHLVPVRQLLGSNDDNLKKLLEIYGIDEAAIDMSKALFVAGSMFWFRSGAFALLRSKGSAVEFEPEGGQLDGTKAHAHERIFSVMAELGGFISVTIDELTGRDDDAYRALPAPEKHKRDIALFSQRREAVDISPFLGPPGPKHQEHDLSRAQQLYRKLPVGLRRMIRRTLQLPH